MKKELIDPNPPNPMTDTGWDEPFRLQPGYSFFHSPSWAKVLAATYDFKPLYFTARADGSSGALPVMEIRSAITGKRGVSLPFSDFCEPLASSPVIFKRLMDEALEYGRRAGWKYLEVRGGQEYFGDDKNAIPSAEYHCHAIDLSPGEDALYGNLVASTRRNIKRAYCAGLELTTGASPEDVSAFYALNCETRKRHGLPPQPYAFFENLREYVLSAGNGFVVLAHVAGNPVAGGVFLFSGRLAVYKYGASIAAFNHLRPNNMVMWEAIRQLSRKGFASLDLGRTDYSDEGLRKYKAGWGAQERKLCYYRYDFKTGTYISKKPSSGLYRKVFRKTPMYFLKAIGNSLYRHLQ